MSRFTVPLENEESIVWLEDVTHMDYVRETLWTCARRRGRIPRWPAGDWLLVGYAELRADAPNSGSNGRFDRRVFWLKSHDRALDPHGVYASSNAPVEAVDPRTVAPGVPGEMTDRAWGGAIEEAGERE